MRWLWLSTALLFAACSDPKAEAPTASAAPVKAERAFDPAGHFAPMPVPRPDDWLYEHEEEGQTFAQYVASQPNIPARGQKIYVLPIGEIGSGPSLRDLEDYAERYFMMPVEVLPAVPIEATRARTRMNDGIR